LAARPARQTGTNRLPRRRLIPSNAPRAGHACPARRSSSSARQNSFKRRKADLVRTNQYPQSENTVKDYITICRATFAYQQPSRIAPLPLEATVHLPRVQTATGTGR
jgi:hypothetical protein